MPVRRFRRRRRNNRAKRTYATKARFMPRALAVKRYGQVSTKTFYFRASGTLNSDNTGRILNSWQTQFPPIAPPPTTDPNRMPDVADSYTFAECYTEYKVLAIKLRLFAANIGTEPGQAQPPMSPIPGFNRGNSVCYVDQTVHDNEVYPIDIVDVMNRGSARMIPSRSSKYTVSLFRPKGNPRWGVCDRNITLADRTPDPWYGTINMLTNFAAPAQRPLWFYTVTYKIIFRGRNYAP